MKPLPLDRLPLPASSDAKRFALLVADEGQQLRIVALTAGRNLAHRLTELGLNIGSEVTVVQRQGGGLVVARGDSAASKGRIALGAGMAAKIQVAPA